MAGGRPTIYRKEYCQKIIDFMATGQSLVQFAKEIGVWKQRIYEWAEKHEEFADALKKAQSDCESYWEKVCQAKTMNKTQGSDAMLIFYMKNRFRWSDRMEQDINQKTSITFTSEIEDDGTIKRDEG